MIDSLGRKWIRCPDCGRYNAGWGEDYGCRWCDNEKLGKGG